MATVQEQVLQSMKTALEGVSGVQVVVRGERNPATIREFPAIALQSDRTRIDLPGEATTNAIGFVMDVSCMAYMAQRDDVFDTMNSLLGDMHLALIADESRGGIAVWTHPTSMRTFIDEGNHEEAPMGVLEVEVHWRTTLTDLETPG